jgi:hypothetical protein
MPVTGNPVGGGNTRQARRASPNREPLSKAEILLCHEFDQAWEHYRHNENTRSQYLGYFFVLAVGSAAFGAQTARSHTLSAPLDLVLFGVFLLTLAFLTGFVYLGVRKAGIVLAHYEALWNDIRRYFYSDSDWETKPYKSLNIRGSGHRALISRWTRMQSSSEFILLFFSFLVVVSEALLSARLFTIPANWPERIIAISMMVITAAIPFLLISGLGTSFRRNRTQS